VPLLRSSKIKSAREPTAYAVGYKYGAPTVLTAFTFMQILQPIFSTALTLAIFAGIWIFIARMIRTKRARSIFIWINIGIASYMAGWIAMIEHSGDPSESMVIFVPLTFEFFHICLGVIAALIIYFLKRRATRAPTA
jgi:hypothetical protein